MIVFRVVRFPEDANSDLDERAAGLRLRISLCRAIGVSELIDWAAGRADGTGDYSVLQVHIADVWIKPLVERLEVGVSIVFKAGNYAGPVEAGSAIIAFLRVRGVQLGPDLTIRAVSLW